MAHCYIVMYDLCQPGRNYEGLYTALKSYIRWGRITESTWAVVSESSATEIRDHLLNFVDSNDRLMVIKSGKEAAWLNALASSEWLKTNLILD